MTNIITQSPSGFKSESAKKDALRSLNNQYEKLAERIRDLCLEIPRELRTAKQDDVYWGVPHDLHLWSQKKADLVLSVFPQAKDLVAETNALLKLRNEVKAVEIITVEMTFKSTVKNMEKTIADIRAMRKGQFDRGLKLYELFKGLPVSVSWHMVQNRWGTRFERTFFYLDGKLTPLNVIMAVLEAKAK